jgi:hypothetical protein
MYPCVLIVFGLLKKAERVIDLGCRCVGCSCAVVLASSPGRSLWKGCIGWCIDGMPA